MTDLKIKDKQLIQMKNISDTLIEATEHFSNQIKDREFAQSIHIFSSIVEGYEAIKKMHTLYGNNSKSTTDLLIKIERNLVFVANQLELKNLIKITEIVQFSLMPNFRKLNRTFLTHSIEKPKITIGIYHDKANPRDVYPKKRIDALIKEGEVQQANLIFFKSKDVDFGNKKIHGECYNDGYWETITYNFPDVIHNVGIASKHQQSITERKLRRLIPFTSFGVGNKFYLPKIMVKHRRYASLLVPFRMVADEQVVYDYLENEKTAVLKPILGARGESIYLFKKKEIGTLSQNIVKKEYITALNLMNGFIIHY